MKILNYIFFNLILIICLKYSANGQNTNPIAKDSNIFVVVEETPQFPGGENARIEYLVKNIMYPENARKTDIQGTVYVTFIIEKDGTISNVKVLRGIGGGCDEESIRVVKNMPKWIPGKQSGKNVRVQFNMPITFKLSDKNEFNENKLKQKK